MSLLVLLIILLVTASIQCNYVINNTVTTGTVEFSCFIQSTSGHPYIPLTTQVYASVELVDNGQQVYSIDKTYGIELDVCVLSFNRMY
jgi:hypothetical protein